MALKPSRRTGLELYSSHLPEFIAKMAREKLPAVVIDTFACYYDQILGGITGLISDAQIAPVAEEEIVDACALDSYTEFGDQAVRRAVQIVLNGGLGTSMGLTRAKSLLTVKEGKSFLKIILDQAETDGVDLVFMNSFNTDQETREAVSALKPRRQPRFFLQHKFPKILSSDLSPAHWPANPELEWNPPGHGEIYTALHTSGLLAQLLKEGIQYALIVNCDNLGATLNRSLLGYFALKGYDIMMEVAQRTPADMKGGHLARHQNGHLILREIAQCPTEECQAFQDIHFYRYFNVNSIWVNLPALNQLIHKEKVVRLPIILNPKTVDPRDKKSPAVFQIETAMGAAIALFDRAAAVKVSDLRFRPVKKCADLLAVRSDCFIFDNRRRLIPNPARRLGRIQIQLDGEFYSRIDDFERRFAHGTPSLIECAELKVLGDVFFEKDITIAGKVTIRNRSGRPAVIPAGSRIDRDLNL
jgi:UTP--glucose-1-phosphate uridylyltransferase